MNIFSTLAISLILITTNTGGSNFEVTNLSPTVRGSGINGNW